MIYKYVKYQSLEDFVNNTSKKACEYTILHKCKGFENNEFNNHCFGCLFCSVNNNENLEKFIKFRSENCIKQISDFSFKGAMIQAPVVPAGLKHPYNSFEKFTAVEETSNIQPWAAGILSNMCSKENRVGLEIPVHNLDYDRNGRLDIGLITTDYLLAIETKTTLADALADERFIEQQKKYKTELDKVCLSYDYVTLIGGSETDLYPPGSVYCSSNIGNKSQRFYKILKDNNMKFISANALLALSYKYINNKDFAYDKIIPKIFGQKNCYGLVSAGKVVLENDDFSIENLF